MQRAGLGLLIVSVAALGACSSAGSGNSGSLGTGGSAGSSGSSAYCAQFAQLPCNPYATTSECVQVFDKVQSGAVQAGCTTQFNAAMNCVDTHQYTCSTSGVVVADPSCKTLVEAYLACNPGAECTSSTTAPSGNATSACTGNCGGGSVSCQITGTTASCTCTAGAHMGTSFTSSGTNPCQGNSIYLHCD